MGKICSLNLVWNFLDYWCLVVLPFPLLFIVNCKWLCVSYLFLFLYVCVHYWSFIFVLLGWNCFLPCLCFPHCRFANQKSNYFECLACRYNKRKEVWKNKHTNIIEKQKNSFLFFFFSLFSILLTAGLGLCVIYLFSMIAFFAFRDFFNPADGTFCSSLIQCFITHFNVGYVFLKHQNNKHWQKLNTNKPF